MTRSPEYDVHGLTGDLGRDGILSPEQQAILDKIQSDAA